MGDRKLTVRELMEDARYPRFLADYIAHPPDPARLPGDYAALPVEERARRYALCMCRFPDWHPVFPGTCEL